MKYCSRHKTGTCVSEVNPQPKSNFYSLNKVTGTLRSSCKKCYAAQKRDNTLHSFKYKLKHVYKISLDEYNRLLSLNNFKCYICNKPQDQCSKRKLNVDHDHKTGRVRGMLCSNCNHLLGQAKDSVDILTASIKYLLSNK